MSCPQPRFTQMCRLKYNSCACIGCDKQFTKFQKIVVKTYKIPKPSLDKENGIVTVFGTADAIGVLGLLKEAIKGKKHFEILPIPKKYASEGKREANYPPPPRQPPQEAKTDMPCALIGGSSSGNMLKYISHGSKRTSIWPEGSMLKE